MKRSKFSEEQIVYAIRQADSRTLVGAEHHRNVAARLQSAPSALLARTPDPKRVCRTTSGDLGRQRSCLF
jgi:hypothetical protein